MNDVPTATDVLSELAGWFEDYNERVPHKGLGMKSPREYVKSLDRQPGLTGATAVRLEIFVGNLCRWAYTAYKRVVNSDSET